MCELESGYSPSRLGPRDSKAIGWKQSGTGFPVRRIWYSCGWQAGSHFGHGTGRTNCRLNVGIGYTGQATGRHVRPNTGAYCLSATESKSDHLVSCRLTSISLISHWVLWWRVSIQADWNARAFASLRAWCRAILPGPRLHTKL